MNSTLKSSGSRGKGQSTRSDSLLRTAPNPQHTKYNLLAGRRVLVTGGAGFLGSQLTDLLVEVGCAEIVVVDNMSSGSPDNLSDAMQSGKVQIIVGDICDDDVMRPLVEGIDTVFHCAALDHAQCVSDPKLALEIMAGATFKLFEECVRSRVRKIILASCASVYGMPRAYPTSETHDHYSNRTILGTAKSFSESLLRSFNDMYGTNYVALRYFDIYGPRMGMQSRQSQSLATWLERIENGLPPILIGDGQQTFDLLHVKDAARANILAAVSNASDVAINIGSGKEISCLALVRLLARLMGKSHLDPVFWEERPFGQGVRRLADVKAARRMIDFSPNIPLADGLGHLVVWWRSQSFARRLH